MNAWTKLGCFLTGWSSKYMAQCSEASRIQLSKYTSALIILMIIWSATGFCLAKNFMKLSVVGCTLVSTTSMILVVMIERQILLAIHPSKWLKCFRVAIAVIMALVGSTILDQVLFSKDIAKQMAYTIEKQTIQLKEQRISQTQAELMTLRTEKDSLNKVNAEMQADINAHPWIVQKTVTNSQTTIVVGGKARKVNNPSVTTNQVSNPKQDIVNANNERIKQIDRQENEKNARMLKTEELARQECSANVGFLEELGAMYDILASNRIALAFYAIFFCLLMSMELFVVVSKTGDTECDYEMAVKGALRVKARQYATVFGLADSNKNRISR